MLHISSYSMKITIQLRIKNPWQPFPRIWIHSLTARPYGLPARLEWSSTIILAHAQKPAQGQRFGPKTLDPKTLKPKTLKTLNPKAENTAYTQYFVQFLFSCSMIGNPQCCSPGKLGLCVVLGKEHGPHSVGP